MCIVFEGLLEKIAKRQAPISVIGMGYVGLPLAVALAAKVDVIGFDVNKAKIEQYNRHCDVTGEVGTEKLRESRIKFTSDPLDLRPSRFHIIAVPTPVDSTNIPNLTAIKEASKLVGQNLAKGSVVVYESTVYPGVTEEICVPVLEHESKLTCGADFKVGYSPERINPGDKVHTVEKITKIVSGMDEESLAIIAGLYGLAVEAGVYRASSIKVAEAAKVIENSQRDINIAFMNELAVIFNRMGIDTQEVLKAAATKWNFLQFQPGLVGGHCIGVDPYYLTYKAQEMGYLPQVILSGRRINDNMGKYIAENTIKQIVKADKPIKGARVLVMGVTFKEDCPDVRNSKVIDVIEELKEYDVAVQLCDPLADAGEIYDNYRLTLTSYQDVTKVDAIIMAVRHKEYAELSIGDLKAKFGEGQPVLIDVKAIFDRSEAETNGFRYWRL